MERRKQECLSLRRVERGIGGFTTARPRCGSWEEAGTRHPTINLRQATDGCIKDKATWFPLVTGQLGRERAVDVMYLDLRKASGIRIQRGLGKLEKCFEIHRM